MLPHPTDPGARLLVLTRGLFATIDAADAELVSRYRWRADHSKGRRVMYAWGYVGKGSGKGTKVPLHRLLLGLPPLRTHGVPVDHIDGDGLNNRRSNLRTATASSNAANRPKNRGPHVSRFKGVTLRGTKWASTICVNRKRRSLGEYRNEEDAARAYDAAALEAWGPFAVLNFPQPKAMVVNE